MVWVMCAHVGGDQDYFLRLAVAQVCGVVPGVWLFGLVLAQQQWGGFVGTIKLLFLRLTTAGMAYSLQLQQ